MEELKIGIFLLNNSLSGAEKRFIRIAREFSKDRENVVLITNSKMIEVAEADSEFRGIIHHLRSEGYLEVISGDQINNKYLRILKNFVELFTIIKKQNIKILHCSLGALKYTFVKKFINVKIIAEITSPDVSKELLMPNKYKNMVKYFDQLITVSDGVYDKTLDSLSKLNMNSLIDSVYCSKIPFFLPNANSDEYSIDDKENLIVFASRFIDRKNPVLFAKAINRLLDESKDWKIAILGKGPLENEIKEILNTYIRSGSVIVENTRDMYGYLSKSKIFVSLIWPDNYPSQSILEAMYMKNAIIATNVGNTYRFVTDENGFLIDDYEVDQVYKTLKKAISDRNTLMSMGLRSNEKVLRDFSKDIYLKELSNIYDRLLKN